ncbi:MAG: hypothetical protein GY769_22400 [bacterium]|nr:hypothetical protein [bacterium]
MRHAIAILGALLAVEPVSATNLANDRDAEDFLQTAEVVEIKPLGKGVTLSHLVTLSAEGLNAKAVWKTIDEYMPVRHFDDGGFPELGFRDSYKSEIAAYRLDRLIGLNQVPPTVERKIRGEDGSLQLWIEDCMTEGERRRKALAPPDAKRFNEQMRRAKVFFQLIHDVDYVNLSNLLIDPDFTVRKVDSSRAFRTQTKILDPESPDRYSRPLVEGLRRLDEDSLKETVGAWLSKKQRSTLLHRRDLILERTERLIAERGEKSVLYP